MRNEGSDRKTALIILLVIFVICSAYVCKAFPEYLRSANTSYFKDDIFSTEISFSEDLECVSQASLANMEIGKIMGNDKTSATEIKPVTFQKGKKYRLKCGVLVKVFGKKREYEDRVFIVSDEEKRYSVDLYDLSGKRQEFHDEYLDGTYYVGIPMSKVEAYDELISAYKKAKNDFIASEREPVSMAAVLSVVFLLAAGTAIAGVVLLIHKYLTANGKSAIPLIISFAIIDLPLVLLSAILVYYTLINP